MDAGLARWSNGADKARVDHDGEIHDLHAKIGQLTAEAYGAERPVDMMDKAHALPTSPQAQQQQHDVINKELAAWSDIGIHLNKAARLSNKPGPPQKKWLVMRFRATNSIFYAEASREIGAPVERDLTSGGLPTMFEEQPESYPRLLLAMDLLRLKALDRARADTVTVFCQTSSLRRGGVLDRESSDDKET